MSDLKKQTSLNQAGVRKLRVTNANPDLIISPCSTMILFTDICNSQIKAFPYCNFCKIISEDNIFITSNGSVRYLICKYCFPLAMENFQLLTDLAVFKVCELIYKNINYSCIWNCGSFHHLDAIHEHERNCMKMPLRKCPKCYFTGRFTSMKEHLVTYHGGNLYFNDIKFYNKQPAGLNNVMIQAGEFCVWLPNHKIVLCAVRQYLNNTKTASDYNYILSTDCAVTQIGYNLDDTFQYVSLSSYDFRKFPTRLHFCC